MRKTGVFGFAMCSCPACFGLTDGMSWQRRDTAVRQRRRRIDRVVGKRTKTPYALASANNNKVVAVAWQKALGRLRVPRGICIAFKTHEEAAEWQWRLIGRPTSWHHARFDRRCGPGKGDEGFFCALYFAR